MESIQSDVILCVDDEAIILISLKQELKKHFGNKYGYETSLNAEDALLTIDDLVQNGTTVILIISDWMMPGLKGDEFLILVRKKYPQIRSIMITGQADPTAIARVQEEAGTYVVMSKPWDRKALIEAVKACCAEV